MIMCKGNSTVQALIMTKLNLCNICNSWLLTKYTMVLVKKLPLQWMAVESM